MTHSESAVSQSLLPIKDLAAISDKTLGDISMSMLNRYRKQGGLLQLINLIEATEPEKQKLLLHLVAQEDPGWAYLVKLKILTVDRILNWPPPILGEVSRIMPEGLQAAFLSSLTNSNKDKWKATLPRILRNRIEELELQRTYHLGEQRAAAVKLIQIVRKLDGDGIFKISSFAPDLEIAPALAA